MALLSQQLSSLIPTPNKPNLPSVENRLEQSMSPVIGAQPRQSQVEPVTPAAQSTASTFPPDLEQNKALRDREQHELQSLLRDMQGIEKPFPRGEHVDLVVPRPTQDDPSP